MGLEIERKFLLKNMQWKKDIISQRKIKQGYLNSTPESTVRVRIKGEKGFITVKGKMENLIRKEFEYEIPTHDAEELLVLCQQPIIAKTRYEVLYHGYIWEIDEFENENKGLFIAEVEMKNADENPDIPEWIGAEVTYNRKYYNSNLIQHPYEKWEEE